MSTSVSNIEGHDQRALDDVGAPIDEFPKLSRGKLAAKRSLDLLLASLSLLFAAPLFLVIAGLVKLTSSGPVFFTQERVGKDGALFAVFKFRTMRDGTHAEVMANELDRHRYAANDFKLPPDDPRITRIGKVLRSTSLDELPQLVNVVRGDMSMVGIRPLLAEELSIRSDYEQDLYRAMRPGLTGLWQIGGRSTIGSVDRYRLDREYAEAWTLKRDLFILARTPIAVLRFHHAH